jgi:hypothetical protein
LDWVPHTYPINSVADVVIALALLTAGMVFVQPSHRVLLGACALGSLFPDFVDLAPAIINRRLAWSLPVVKFFPWHWRQYSGSIYDSSRKFESLLSHLLVIISSFALVYFYRRRFFMKANS